MITDMITPENLAILVGAIAGLVMAISKAVEWIGKGAGNWITSRAEAKSIQADAERKKVEAEAADKAAENRNIATILSLMERQTTISEDAVTAQNSQSRILEMYGQKFGAIDDTIKTSNQVQAELAVELRALNANVATFPKTIDGTLAEAIDTLTRLEKQIDGFDASHVFLRDTVTEIKRHTRDILDILSKPRPPAIVEPPKTTTLLNADGAEHNATIDRPIASGE